VCSAGMTPVGGATNVHHTPPRGANRTYFIESSPPYITTKTARAQPPVLSFQACMSGGLAAQHK
jgi:hypothetical protein